MVSCDDALIPILGCCHSRLGKIKFNGETRNARLAPSESPECATSIWKSRADRLVGHWKANDFHLQDDPIPPSNAIWKLHKTIGTIFSADRPPLDWSPGHYMPTSFPFKTSMHGVESPWWVPETAMPDDLVIFASGSELPLVVRPSAVVDEHTFVGPAMLRSWPGERFVPGDSQGYNLPFQSGVRLRNEAEMFLRIKEWLIAKREPADEEVFNLF
jgi:hypothetical protein